MIPYNDFCRLLTDTTEFSTLEAYIAECGGSVPLDDVQEVCKLLGRIWAMGHDGLTIQSIADAAGSSLRGLAMDYKLSYKTVYPWKSGERHPPEWLLPLLAYAVLSDVE